MGDVVTRSKRTYSEHDEATIQRALVELAACSGNYHKAARNLDEEKIHLEPSTIWRWANKQHIEKYRQIRAEILPKITEAAADQHMALARQQMELAAEAAALVAARMPQMDDRDLVNAMGKADIGSGIHTEKAQLLAGQPTQIVQKDASETLRKLKARGIVIDAEVVSEEDVTEDIQPVTSEA